MNERMDEQLNERGNGRRITDELRNEVFYAPMEPDQRGRFSAIADRIDAALAESYVELPKDADGEPIHIGDVMEWPDGKTFDVVGIGEGVLFYIENEDGPADWTGASTKRRHHTPTVEDVLREFALKAAGRECMTARPDVITEYAAKLRLAGDAE